MLLPGSESCCDIYRTMSLIELVRRIVAVGDRDALAELHNNRPISAPAEGASCRIIEYIEMLKTEMLDGTRRRRGLSDIAVEEACSMTVDRFSLLPGLGNDTTGTGSTHSGTARKGTDCRYYFGGYLRRMERIIQERHEYGSIQTELLAQQHLKTFITEHLILI